MSFGDEVRCKEFMSQGMQKSAVEGSRVFKADFDFRWVNVDIDGFRVDLHVQETDGQATDH